MSAPGILVKTLRDLRWQIFWYGVGLALMAALVVYIYPSYSDQLAEFEIPEALRGFIGEADYASPEGFLSAEFFSWAPALLVVFSIMAGTSALAGEEASGTLEMLLAQPISRRRLAIEKLAGFALGACLIAGVTCAGWLISVPFVDIDASYLKLLGATAQLVPIVLLFGALAVWAGALLPDRRLATGLVTAIAVVSYFLNYLGSVVDVMGPLRWASFFYYQDGANALSHGVEPLKLAVLLGAAALFAVLAVASFERREIGVRSAGLSLPRLLLR